MRQRKGTDKEMKQQIADSSGADDTDGGMSDGKVVDNVLEANKPMDEKKKRSIKVRVTMSFLMVFGFAGII